MLVATLPKLKRVTCRTSGRKLAIVRVYTVDSGVLAFAVYALKSVDCMKLAIYYSVTTSHEKSETVKWVDVSMPDKRSCRLKDHKVLEDVAMHNPDSEDIFQSNLLDTYSSQRSNDLQDVCLYDFVANSDYRGTDSRTGDSIASLQSLDSPTTDSLIPKRKSRDKAITLL